MQKKKLLGCGLVLSVCLWVIYRTSHLAIQYDNLLMTLQWEVDRCIHKQGLDSNARLGSVDLFSRASLGGYPDGLVSISPAVLHQSTRRFSYRAPDHLHEKISAQLSSLMWPISVTSDPWPVCSHYHDEGYVFLVSLPEEKDWYYSIHTSTLLPLYALLMYRHHLGPHSVHGYRIALLPAVENYELESIDWSSPVLKEKDEHGAVQGLLRGFAGHMSIVLLTEGPESQHTTTCFMTLHFGVPAVNLSDSSLLSGFVELMLSQLSIPLIPITQPLLCLNRGSDTERIVNLPELVMIVDGIVDVLTMESSGLSYREQVSQLQMCTIMVGFHGDYFLNALYMPSQSVFIQLLSTDEKENEQYTKYADVARARGHYLEWTNPTEDSHPPGNDVTEITLNVESFVKVINHALSLGINDFLRT